VFEKAVRTQKIHDEALLSQGVSQLNRSWQKHLADGDQ
jgi:hypothetical protein